MREITWMSLPFSPNKPFCVCRRAVGDRSSPRRTHEVDVYCLSEEGGNQSQDASWLVLHATKGGGRPAQQDPRRSQLCQSTHASFRLSVFHATPPPPFRFTGSRITTSLRWMGHLKAVCCGMGARTCRTSPSESSTSPTMTAGSTSATFSADLSLTSSRPQFWSPRTSSCGWRRKVRPLLVSFLKSCLPLFVSQRLPHRSSCV